MNLCIVEDDAPLLNNLLLLLQDKPDVSVTAHHLSAEEASESVDWSRTDVLLIDLDLPQMSGIDLIRQVGPLNPDLSILVYTVHEDRASVLEAIKAGACGYLVKGQSSESLAEAIREIHAGGAPMSPKIARSLLLEMQTAEKPAIPPEKALTQREISIMRLLESGHSYKTVAAELSVSVHTVNSHIKNIYQKLQAHGRIDAIRKSRIRGEL